MEEKTITKEMVLAGMRQGIVRFAPDPCTGTGTVCRIGGRWFFFGGPEADEEDPVTYEANTDEADNAELILSVLDAFAEDRAEEYEYYRAYLHANLKKAEPPCFSVSTPMGKLTAKPGPDSRYPGIWVLHDSPGQPGMLLEYDPEYGTLVARVWSMSDPEGDPVAVIDLVAGGKPDRKGETRENR